MDIIKYIIIIIYTTSIWNTEMTGISGISLDRDNSMLMLMGPYLERFQLESGRPMPVQSGCSWVQRELWRGVVLPYPERCARAVGQLEGRQDANHACALEHPLARLETQHTCHSIGNQKHAISMETWNRESGCWKGGIV